LAILTDPEYPSDVLDYASIVSLCFQGGIAPNFKTATNIRVIAVGGGS
jgi:hypothetical protein